MKVFLGGTCNGSTWRDEMVRHLKSAGIDYFNPVVTNWDDKAREREFLARALCDLCIYTITPKMIGSYAVAEVVDDGHRRPQKTIMILLRKDGDSEFTDDQWRSLHAVAQLVGGYGVKCFYDFKDAVDFIASLDMPIKAKKELGMSDMVKYKMKRFFYNIMKQREEILKAFIAETGLLPSEVEQVEVQHPDGTISWYVRKRGIGKH